MKLNTLLHNQIEQISPEVKMEMELSAAMVERIESLLRRKGITHRELAKRIGCDESQIIRWTRGFPNFTFNAIARISCAIGEPLIDINSVLPDIASVTNGYNTNDTKPQYLSDNDPVLYRE